jgi:hypothetical protein
VKKDFKLFSEAGGLILKIQSKLTFVQFAMSLKNNIKIRSILRIHLTQRVLYYIWIQLIQAKRSTTKQFI